LPRPGEGKMSGKGNNAENKKKAPDPRENRRAVNRKKKREGKQMPGSRGWGGQQTNRNSAEHCRENAKKTAKGREAEMRKKSREKAWWKGRARTNPKKPTL